MLRMAYVSFLVIVLILIITSVNLSNFVLDNDIKEIIIYDKDILNNFRKALSLDSNLNDYEIIKKIKDDEQKENILTWYNEQRDAEINGKNNSNTKINGLIDGINKTIDSLENDINNLKGYNNGEFTDSVTSDLAIFLNIAKNTSFQDVFKEINYSDGLKFEEKVTLMNDLKYYENLISIGLPKLEANINDEIKKREDLNKQIVSKKDIDKISALKFTDPEIKEYKSFYNSIKDKDLVKYVFLTQNEYDQLVNSNDKLTQEKLNSLSENQRLYLSSRDPINNYIIGFSSVFLITFLISSFYLYLTISDYNNITSLIGVILTIIAFLITLMIEKNGNELTEKDNQIIGNIIGWSMIPILIVMIFNRPINNNAGLGFLMFMIALCLICLSLIFGFNKNIEDKKIGWNDNFTGVLVGIGLAIFYMLVKWTGLSNKLSTGLSNKELQNWLYDKHFIICILCLILLIIFGVLADKENKKEVVDKNAYIVYSVLSGLFGIIFVYCGARSIN